MQVKLTDAKLASLYDNLKKHEFQLRGYFLKPYILSDDATIDDFRLPVISYSILFHAACEDFAESVCKYCVSTAIKEWLAPSAPSGSRRYSRCLVSISMNFLSNLPSFDEKNPNYDVFNHVRTELAVFSSDYSKLIIKNHGARAKYLHEIARRIGIDYNANMMEAGSLGTLASYRGTFAHQQYTHKTKIPEPSEIIKITSDVLEFFHKFALKAEESLR